MRRSVTFIKSNDWGSAVLRADQVSAGLAGRGWTAASVHAADCHSSGSIAVVVKFTDLETLETLKHRGNRVVFDPVDLFANSDFSKLDPDQARAFFETVDAVIHPNAYSIHKHKHLFRPEALHRVIPHHWDARYSAGLAGPGKNPHERFSIGYIGNPENFLEDPRLAFVPLAADFREQLRLAATFACHFSVRPDMSLKFRFKPATKVSLAASVGANIVASKDFSALELLGGEYPYFTSADPEAVLAAIERAREDFGGSQWRQGLEMMALAREQTSLDAVCSEYERLFADMA